MARHWSHWVDVSDRQARALDIMARENDKGEGIQLLMEVGDCSRSHIQQLDRLSLQRLVDDVFAKYRKGISE